MTASLDTLRNLWRIAGLPDDALSFVDLSGRDPVFPSTFAVGTAAQATIGAAALAACELAHARGVERQRVAVDMTHAAVECTGAFTLDGKEPETWGRFSGLYRCADGYVRIHANFEHHQDGALRLLGLDPKTATREDAERALLAWRGCDFEDAAAAQGLVATMLRTFDEWDATPQGRAIAAQPLMTITRIGDGPALALPALSANARPLDGVRVLDLTRILAGPVGGRALAAFGADVMLVNGPHLPNIPAIADTSRGKRSALLDLRSASERDMLWRLIDEAHVFAQGYRPGGVASLGFGPEALAARRPGIVYTSLTAYGTRGPWASRRGFDSLVQTAMGFNAAEGEAAGDGKPRPLPMQMLDMASGFLMAFGAAAALWKQQREGGSWHVEVSLAQTGHWLRGLGRVDGGLKVVKPDIAGFVERYESGFGELVAVTPSAQLERTGAGYVRRSERPGVSAARW
ncbi:CoA transferase (plasmid) [Burkholderia sp. SFA1]|uniref:CoA transferase n=1 Tax=unclassified Caballeronia TaxID=2646786 RepID=UPI001F2C78B7|nr:MULTISPECIES: CoA transferase [unclassified Caballeronia]MCE4545883.1 CoA transferase [Caballeronia sp. PC1]MCE4571995.1 CoA transferase [Caballeronia sp. CLC5]BBQ01237.1 CoA transferase [Burkholderia sp. SFA1]